MIIDIVHRCLLWLLTWEVVGLFAAVLVRAGMPAEAAPLVVVIAALLVIYKISSDRYFYQRWQRRFYRWKNR